ncbi:unnamed protein product [Ceratitis capitata]|uniref:(Mediterranean fruit fly) hypothetical protein n=1 Tax=Ceratitis capitata TaxID=7213 RepID=A0A811URH1_CERCA|nr:unnamed protein product [Ceratitis capitata]
MDKHEPPTIRKMAPHTAQLAAILANMMENRETFGQPLARCQLLKIICPRHCCQEYAVPHMQDLLPVHKNPTPSMAPASAPTAALEVEVEVEVTVTTVQVHATLSTACFNRNCRPLVKKQTLQHQHSYHTQLATTPPPPPPPAPTTATAASTHCPPPPIPPLPPLLGHAGSNEKYYATTAISKANASTNAAMASMEEVMLVEEEVAALQVPAPVLAIHYPMAALVVAVAVSPLQRPAWHRVLQRQRVDMVIRVQPPLWVL